MRIDPDAEPIPGSRFVLSWLNPISWIRVGLRARKTDLVLVPWVTPFHAIPILVIMGLVRRTSSLCVIHNVLPHERMPFDRILTRLAIRPATASIVHSEAQQRLLSDLLPEARSHVVQMPPHLLAASSEPPPPSSPFRLIQPGFVRPYKGVDTALRGLRIYLDRNPSAATRFTIVGDFWDPTAQEVQALVESLGLGEAVSIDDGYVSDAKMLSEITKHHAGLLPYSSATQSGLIPAILGAGRPVITTDVGGLVEQVRPGENAVVCPPGDPSAIADAIDHLRTNYESFQAIADESWSDTAWDDVARRVVDVAQSPPSAASPG